MLWASYEGIIVKSTVAKWSRLNLSPECIFIDHAGLYIYLADRLRLSYSGALLPSE